MVICDITIPTLWILTPIYRLTHQCSVGQQQDFWRFKLDKLLILKSITYLCVEGDSCRGADISLSPIFDTDGHLAVPSIYVNPLDSYGLQN